MLLVRAEVRSSPIHGTGLFAAEAIAKGRPVWVFHPRIDHIFLNSEALPTAVRRLIRRHGYIDGAWFVVPGDYAMFINHSPAPNVGVDNKENSIDCALRDIAIGEELTQDYRKYGPLGACSEFLKRTSRT
jgi:hypothetical protein